MRQLQISEYKNILPLYYQEGRCFPLILAVIQQKQDGWIFVNDEANYSFSIVVTKFGFMYVIGAQNNDGFDNLIAGFLESTLDYLPSYVLWYSPSLHWQKKLGEIPDNLMKVRERIRFQFDKSHADYLMKELDCPAGFEIKLLDSHLLANTAKFGVNLASRFWKSAEDFLTNGIGVCIVKDGEILSLCYSACIVDGLAEVDIVTLPEYRQKGLSRLLAQHFVAECLRTGITPTWDCFAYNKASERLARRLGFVKLESYPFYTFNIPIILPSC